VRMRENTSRSGEYATHHHESEWLVFVLARPAGSIRVVRVSHSHARGEAARLTPQSPQSSGASRSAAVSPELRAYSVAPAARRDCRQNIKTVPTLKLLGSARRRFLFVPDA
jgi:hypothetical protein